MTSSPAHAPRVTELANPLSQDIDVACDEGIVRILASVDSQMFTSSGGLEGIHDASKIRAAVQLVRRIAAALNNPKGRVVLTGCGTSGRLSHLETRGFNKTLSGTTLPGRFDYIAAGGDASLLLPQEAAEDKPDQPVADLQAWQAAAGVGPEDPVVVIGISCGLSATYVGAMLDSILSSPRTAWTAVAVGFNQIEAVHAVKVDGWASSFHAVLGAMKAQPDRAIVLNPTLGAEGIAGSSRMKGGSMTKILIETLTSAAIQLAITTQGAGAGAGAAVSDAVITEWIRDGYMAYENTVRAVYSQHVPALARLLSTAGTTLNTPVGKEGQYAKGKAGGAKGFSSPTGSGRVVYLGADTAGVLGLIDASECTPTYGALFNDVRGFVAQGWAGLANKEGDLSGKPALVVPAHVRADHGLAACSAVPESIGVGFEAFHSDVLPFLGASDLVVGLIIHGDAHADTRQALVDTLQAAKAAGCKTSFITVLPCGNAEAQAAVAALSATATVEGVSIQLPATALRPGSTVLISGAGAGRTDVPMPHSLAELALKLALNATTTGAHIRRGTIFRNRMVNVMLTNVKLFHRAVGIVADVVGTGHDIALRAVIRSIYGLDGAEPAQLPHPPVKGAAASTADHVPHTRLQELAFAPVGLHVAAASSKLGVVPVAIILATEALHAARAGKIGLGLPLASAKALLEKERIIRRAVEVCLENTFGHQ